MLFFPTTASLLLKAAAGLLRPPNVCSDQVIWAQAAGFQGPKVLKVLQRRYPSSCVRGDGMSTTAENTP